MAYDFEKREEQLRVQIRENEELINKLIDYREFLNIYAPYKNEMSEVEFSEILGINYQSYLDIKNRGKKHEY